ncbi:MULTISPECIES: DsbA family oxidoreductase [Miniimonas]|uniref:DsbA family oxidoreductase n=1 Tax=Miniimonas TaxID=947525 RepID=UPI001F3080DA|nr:MULTISPECIES: DsbA family oxidoreductase [Miniimonas]
MSQPLGEPLQVEVWSDVQCPWCWIGRRRLQEAVAATGEEIELVYRSFELAPDVPVDYDGTSVDFLADRKGMPRDQVRAMMARVTEIAAGDGLEYHLETARQTNTVLAHELLHLARERGVQEHLKERLFGAYFTENRHVGDVEELVSLAVESGLDAAEARAALADHRYLPAVRADVAQARAYGINGVPFTVVDGALGVSGAQSADVFAAALRQARAARAGATSVTAS